jgi:hypothetical protein
MIEATVDAAALTKGFIRTHANRFTPAAADAMRAFLNTANSADVSWLIEMVSACAAAKKEG